MQNKVGAFMVIDVFERRARDDADAYNIGICALLVGVGGMVSIDYACRFRKHMTTLTFLSSMKECY